MYIVVFRIRVRVRVRVNDAPKGNRFESQWDCDP